MRSFYSNIFLVLYHCKNCLIFLTVLTGIEVYTDKQTKIKTVCAWNSLTGVYDCYKYHMGCS